MKTLLAIGVALILLATTGAHFACDDYCYLQQTSHCYIEPFLRPVVTGGDLGQFKVCVRRNGETYSVRRIDR